VQYSLVNDAERNLAAAGRASVTRLFGPDDLSMSVYGVELVASRDVSVFSPYAGVSGYLARGAERSSVVKLANENVFGIQAMAGVAVNVSVLRVGVEANVAKVPGYSLKVGLGF
jgi:hypothetical protein